MEIKNVIYFNQLSYCILPVEDNMHEFNSNLIKRNYTFPSTNQQRKNEHFTGLKSIAKIIHSPLVLDRSETEGIYSEDAHLSITHTRENAAAIVHQHFNPGIDIENFREKILVIQHKFVRDDEKKLNVFSNEIQFFTLIWSVKEAIYKAHRKGNADFKKDIQIVEIDFFKRSLKAKLFDNIYFKLNFKIEDTFLISYTTHLKIKE
jgi:4'-phosphopantetheinyl transferase EntD